MRSLSVIVPVFNGEKYLRSCLESLINQSYKEIEIVCVNDGSIDDTLSILDEFKKNDERITIVDKTNEGYGKAVNEGVKIASGDYIAIVESDDQVLPDMYEKLMNAAYVSRADIVRCGFTRLYTIYEQDFEQYEDVCCGIRELYDRNLSFVSEPEIIRTHKATWCAIYNRNFLIKNDIWHNETPGASFQDNGFWFMTLMTATKIYNIDEPGYRYRMDNLDASTYSKDKSLTMIREYDWIKNQLISKSMWETCKGAYYWARLTALRNEWKRVISDDREEIARQIRADLIEMSHEEIDSSLFDEEMKKELFELFLHPKAFSKFYSDSNDRIKKTLINNGNHLFIYGAGVWGRKCLDFLRQYGRLEIPLSFMVSDLSEITERVIAGTPIFQVDDKRIEKENARIITAVSEAKYPEIITQLKKNGYNYVYKYQEIMRDSYGWRS